MQTVHQHFLVLTNTLFSYLHCKGKGFFRPKIMIKAISTKYIPSEQNSPSFDPLDLDEKKYSILDQGIIFFTRNQTSRVIVDNAKICVFFYYTKNYRKILRYNKPYTLVC